VRWSDVVSRSKLRPAYTQMARSVGGASHGCASACFGEFRLCYSAIRRGGLECALIGCRISPALSEKTPHLAQEARVLLQLAQPVRPGHGPECANRKRNRHGRYPGPKAKNGNNIRSTSDSGRELRLDRGSECGLQHPGIADSDRKIAAQRLRDDHAVEWIAVLPRQPRRQDYIRRIDRQFHGAHIGYDIGPGRQQDLAVETTQARLNADFPSRYGRYPHIGAW